MTSLEQLEAMPGLDAMVLKFVVERYNLLNQNKSLTTISLKIGRATLYRYLKRAGVTNDVRIRNSSKAIPPTPDRAPVRLCENGSLARGLGQSVARSVSDE